MGGAFVEKTEPSVRFQSISDGLSKTLLAGDLDYGLSNYRRSMCKNNTRGYQPGDCGWHAFPGAMRCGFEPGNRVP